MSQDVKQTKLSDREWDTLVTIASGYLAETNGDLRLAMARAVVAHRDLIAAVKSGAISVEIPEGRVSLVVPEEGGIALKLENR